MQLRPYQSEAVATTWKYLRARDDNPCIVIPTGGGKTLVLAEMIREALTSWPGTRICVLAHVRELVAQNADKLTRYWPDAPAGIYSAGLRRRDRFEPVIFASIQSVAKRAMQLGRFDLLLIDEAHRVPLRSEGQYRQFIDDCRKANPQLRVVGLTATPYRLGGGPVCAPEYILNEVCYEARVADLIRDGYLCRLVSKAGVARADLSGVHVSNGEYVGGELERAVDARDVVEAACDEIVALCADRKAWLVFCAGVKHAQHVSGALCLRGIASDVVTGDTPARVRDERIAAFQRGHLRALVNVNVLSEGFDVTHIDAVILMRPTKSAALYYQHCGRGMRLHPGKGDCIAEGQRVLTDSGLVPIERVTIEMKVWDGVEFVRHRGAFCRGEQEVIRYAGLEATPDHRVWTAKGWQALGQCAIEQAAVAVTGIGGKAVRETEGRFRRDRAQNGTWKAALTGGLHRLRRAIVEGLHQLDERRGRLSQMRKPTICAEMACYACDSSEAEMYQSQRRRVRPLRGARDSVQVFFADVNGSVGPRQPRPASRPSTGQDRQRWSLRARKPALSNPGAKPIEHAEAKSKCCHARIPSATSGNQIRRLDIEPSDSGRPFVRRDSGQVLQKIVQAKRRVWDILDAGPRHRFTSEGVLVHNCLVLDFAGNIIEHGPIDAIRPPRKPGEKAKSEQPMRECPQCHSLLAVQIRKCPDCGYEFPIEDRARHDASASDAAILSDEIKLPVEHTVNHVRYTSHVGKSGVPTLQVTYTCGLRTFREWVCLEHGGFARAKALSWWMARDKEGVTPRTVEAALTCLDRLRKPATIRVVERGKFPEIVGYEIKPNATSDPAGNAGNIDGHCPQFADSDPVRRLRELQSVHGVLQPMEGIRTA